MHKRPVLGTIFTLTLALLLSSLCMGVHAEKIQELDQEQIKTLDFAQKLDEHIDAGLVLRSGAVYQDISENGKSRSDIALPSAELGISAKVNEYVSAEIVYLYEDPPFAPESTVGMDSGFVTLTGGEDYPGHISLGKMYVPYGALMTRFPGDPLTSVPVTLTLGEISEEALLAGYDKEFSIGSNTGRLSLSGYTFNGDIRSSDRENSIDDFGADASFTLDTGNDASIKVGGSYISNLADTDGITETLGSKEINSLIGGASAYFCSNFRNVFLDAEYMAALDDFKASEIKDSNGKGAEPSVWNIETGFNYNWGRNLEVALKYAGSDQSSALDIPETRYGITFNQEIFERTILSLGALYDEFEEERFFDAEDSRTTLFSQLKIEL